MQFDEKKALEIIAANNLKPATLRVWRLRSSIPKRYAETEKRILLTDVLPTKLLDVAIKKYGTKLQRLLQIRKYKPKQKDNYYRLCLASLCKECSKSAKEEKLC